ncbi:MAG: sulfur carrier protein ThiS adenylyltransferase ThiF [Candidatus Nanoarchaeia archaeon]
MNVFEKSLLTYFPEPILRKLGTVSIGIAGAGGLGSNCAMNLVRSGFKKILICDFDKVEIKNLNRQFYFLDQLGKAKVIALSENLKRINPDLNIDARQLRIDAQNAQETFAQCDVIIEAFDCAISKKILFENCAKFAKLYVGASGIAGWGNSDSLVVKKISDRIYIVGDGVSEACKSLPPCSPRVNIAAAKEADIVLNWALTNYM